MDEILAGMLVFIFALTVGLFIGHGAATNGIQKDCEYGNVIRIDKVTYTCIKKVP